MPRKKYDLKVEDGDREAVRQRLAKPRPIKNYKEMVEYLNDLIDGQRLEVIPKETLTAGVYAGSVLLQAIKMAKEEDGGGDVLPSDMQQGTLQIDASRQDMVALLTAGNSGVQIRLLKKQQQRGNIITVEAQEVAPDTVQESVKSITDRAHELIARGKELEAEGDLFADE